MVTRENIINRLKQLGYTATELDWEQIDFELDKTICYVKNYCTLLKFLVF